MHLVAGQSVFDLIPFLLAVLVLPLVSVYSGARLDRKPGASLVPRYGRTIARGVAVTLFLFLLWALMGRPLAALGLDMPVRRIGLIMLGVVALAALVLAAQVIYLERLAKPARIASLRAQIKEIKILPRTTRELIVFLVVAVMAGIWEELLFRGFLLWFLTPYVTIWGAVLLSTAVFALGHIYQGWKGLPRSGGLGLLFAVGYALSGSLWWLIALHALVDIFGGLAAWKVSQMPVAE